MDPESWSLMAYSPSEIRKPLTPTRLIISEHSGRAPHSHVPPYLLEHSGCQLLGRVSRIDRNHPLHVESHRCDKSDRIRHCQPAPTLGGAIQGLGGGTGSPLPATLSPRSLFGNQSRWFPSHSPQTRKSPTASKTPSSISPGVQGPVRLCHREEESHHYYTPMYSHALQWSHTWARMAPVSNSSSTK